MMEPPLSELESQFEPQQRARSNTWPLPRPDNFADGKDDPSGAKGPGAAPNPAPGTCLGPPGTDMLLPLPGAAAAAAAKKNSSRRNAWGNLSYADLITQAITSAPDKRLTLSQIYEWMVQNVAYFKDKGDSNSSAGWKNSIRHNLSLHNRFMRVQNEGTGKSSWWMINPDAKPGKSARRRATSMEGSKFEKRRGRVKKKVEALRNGLPSSPVSSVSESLDIFPDSPNIHYQLSPDFRPRASSNASSCGGRLSPIHSVEPDWTAPPYQQATGYTTEQLAGNLEATMKIHQNQSDVYLNYQPVQQQPPPPPYRQHMPPPQPLVAGHPAPPPQQPSPQQQPAYVGNFPQPDLPSRGVSVRTPTTMMGQLMGALSNPTLMDDLNLNIETLHGFDCNVDEVIKHELSLDGTLDFNFSQHNHLHHHHHHHHPGATASAAAAAAAAAAANNTSEQSSPAPPYTRNWVH